MPAIYIRNLKKTYKDKGKKFHALKGVSFSVKKGEMYGLLGANGAGKTTIINILSGLLRKDSGTVRILGKDPLEDEEFIKNQMNVGSAYSWLTGILTVRQNLKVYAKLYGVKDVNKRVDELITMFGIDKIKDKKVFRLSTGQIVRVILCKTLINNPPILLLDECTVGLDPEIAQKTRRLLKEYQKTHNTTIIFTSHNMIEVETLCDRVGILFEGKLVMEGTPKHIRKAAKKKTIKIDAVGPISLKTIIEKFKVKIDYAKKDQVIFTAPSSLKLNTIINALIKNKFDIIDVNVRTPSLEDVFINLSRGRK